MHSLVSTEWLAERLDAPDLIILDATRHLAASARDAEAEFLAGHIPGARFLGLADLTGAVSPVGKTLPGPELAAAKFGEVGIGPESQLVVYDDSDVKTSSRAWFILRGYGVRSVAILDGGLAKWQAEGRPLESGQPDWRGGVFRPAAFEGVVRHRSDMLANLESAAEQVVDARDAARFSGEARDTVHGLPGGHIPGSRNLWFRDLFNAEGTFRSARELRAAFDRAGVDLGKPIVTTCGSGLTASVLLFALHLLGVEDAALYDGSWAEWGSDPQTPKETGSA